MRKRKRLKLKVIGYWERELHAVASASTLIE
jgi:hypothetical protein